MDSKLKVFQRPLIFPQAQERPSKPYRGNRVLKRLHNVQEVPKRKKTFFPLNLAKGRFQIVKGKNIPKKLLSSTFFLKKMVVFCYT